MPLSRQLQIKELKATIVCLKAQLSALNAQEPIDKYPPWAEGLSRQSIELVYLLVRAYPRTASTEYLFDNINHSTDFPSEDVLKTNISRTRKLLGREIIQTIRTLGYRATPELVSLVREKSDAHASTA